MSDDEPEISTEAASDASESESTSGADEEANATDAEGADGDAADAGPEAAPGEPPADQEPAKDDAASRSPSMWPAALMKRPRWMVVAQILIAPLLAAGAVGVHWWLNVPDKIIESPNDQGSKKKKKKKKRERRKRRNRADNTRNDRSPDELQRDWDQYADSPFDDEPVRPVWARRHQALVNRAVVVARREAFKGAPEQPRVVLSGTKCHTVRCRFSLRSQYPHALDAVGDALSRLQSDDVGVWRTFDIEPSAPEGEGADTGEHYVDVTVSFLTDDTESRTLSIGPEADAAAGEAEAPEAEGEAAAGEAETPEAEGKAVAGKAGAGKAVAGKAPTP